MVLREHRAYLHPLDVQRAVLEGHSEGLGKMDKRSRDNRQGCTYSMNERRLRNFEELA
ncbi:hypothetical protein M0R72_13300 [Candidatus Pacearchaeota archaeon]|nr:hypothetical protein [Candidatus Pacearchaeota archaeon]